MASTITQDLAARAPGVQVSALVLASTSPFRQALLRSAGVQARAEAPEVEESRILHPVPRELARLRAEAKAMAVAARVGADGPAVVIIGADQVMSLGTQVFDKARDEAEALARLALLAGRTHVLHSAFCLILAGGPHFGTPRLLASDVLDLPMAMRPLEQAALAAYVATGEWRGSVGCYQFENRGVHLFHHVSHDASAIVGLPLQPLLEALRRHGMDLLIEPHGPWWVAL